MVSIMNDQLMYGYPISSIFNRIIGLIILSLIIILIAVSISPMVGLLSSMLLPILLVLFTWQFKTSFSKNREKMLNELIKEAAIKEHERVLDIGTGSGYIAIHLAKQVSHASIIGIDKFDLKIDGRIHWFIDELKINFFGNTLYHAKQNAKIEQVQNTVDFVKSDLLKPFPFDSGFFDIVVSSQFLYCIPSNQVAQVLKEIDRVLKPHGRLVFFETIRFFTWNVKEIVNYYQKRGYDIEINTLEYFSNKCMITAKKP
jgi:ubiquinone/menaquinone biosynthesis C-methylase UbiE